MSLSKVFEVKEGLLHALMSEDVQLAANEILERRFDRSINDDEFLNNGLREFANLVSAVVTTVIFPIIVGEEEYEKIMEEYKELTVSFSEIDPTIEDFE